MSPTESDLLIRKAIIEKRMVEFDYNGYHRIAGIHVYGEKNGALQILEYQTDGKISSGSLPQWRRFNLSALSNMKVLNETFPGPREAPSGLHSSWDEKFLLVE